MLTNLALCFGLPLLLTLLMPGVRLFLAAVVGVGGAIGWQDWAFWQAANSPDFIGPPALPLTEGAVDLAVAGFAIGVLTRGTALGLSAARIHVTPAKFAAIFIGAGSVVGAAYALGFIRL
jgi:hypothetical protein